MIIIKTIHDVLISILKTFIADKYAISRQTNTKLKRSAAVFAIATLLIIACHNRSGPLRVPRDAILLFATSCTGLAYHTYQPDAAGSHCCKYVEYQTPPWTVMKRWRFNISACAIESLQIVCNLCVGDDSKIDVFERKGVNVFRGCGVALAVAVAYVHNSCH